MVFPLYFTLNVIVVVPAFFGRMATAAVFPSGTSLNTLATDFQYRYDVDNQVIYLAHRDPMPTQVTITYMPEYQDVSEIQNDTWINYLLRLSEAFMKKSLGRSRSKYRVEGSNVSYDGEQLLQEANTELEAIRTELEAKKPKLVVLN